MTADRPDPDTLLAQVNADAARAGRGRLKIFFGASAGVGKTVAMLLAAREAQAQGVPLVIGVVETHGRADTEAAAAGLPRLPLKAVPHRGRELHEFDLNAALAFGSQHPGGLVLLDETAHSNAPGSRHPKRWQDVEELRDAGLDVWTTMNVQHLESLNDIVGRITGVRVRETVPDRLFDQADEVVVVDLPPDELLLRLKQGKVYLPPQAERARANFFRKGNLLALRELALRRTADRVDGEMQAYRRRNGRQSGLQSGHPRDVQDAMSPVWPNRESLLACIGPGPHAEQVVRACARLATQLDVPWHAVYVQTPATTDLPQAQRQQVLRALTLAHDLGATTATVSAPDAQTALTRYAREHNLPRLVLGQRTRAWRWPRHRPLAERILQRADDLDVLQIALPRGPAVDAPAAFHERAPVRTPWPGYAAAAALCGLTALLATPLIDVFELSSLVLLFLLAVVGSAWRFGRGPAVLAAALSVLLFNVFFVPPRFSLRFADERFLVTFAVMLVVGLVVGQLTAGLKAQARAANERERRVRSLYAMSRDLGAALLTEQVAEIGARFLQAEFGARSSLLVADLDDRLQRLPGGTAPADPAVAQWAFEHDRPTGRGTDTLPAGPCLMLPLKAPMRLRGVLAIEPTNSLPWSPEERQLLDTCAALLAISLERIHYIEVAQSSTVQMASERLRNSLLSAISHDLRTPLASLVGLAETLQLTQPPPTAQQAQMAQAMRDSALRMNALVNNLLDMARLEGGAVQLNRQWQPLEEVLGSALAACAERLAAHPLQLTLPDELPLLQLDAVLFERVLVNLLENAAKYTPPGTPLVLRAQADDRDVTLCLEDRGPGLPPGKESAIFEKFVRGHAESATAGVGLGLAICQAIVEAHSGRIRAENAPGGGARFIVTLPRGEPPADTGADLDTDPAANPAPLAEDLALPHTPPRTPTP